MIATLIGFGIAGGVAVVSVLTYRAFAFWLPIVPGRSPTCDRSGTRH